jgi:hypothetical protein
MTSKTLYSAKPTLGETTENIQVWYVQFAGNGRWNKGFKEPEIAVCDTYKDACDEATQLEQEGAKCVSITGPHDHTVHA